MAIALFTVLLWTPLPDAMGQAPDRTRVPKDLVQSLTKRVDLTYARYGDRQLKLDLYRPSDTKKPLPAIVCIHGGGWFKGDRSSMTNSAQVLASRGYVTVTISYRLSGEAKFPAAIRDCKASVRWLRANAEQYGIRPDSIGVVGLSAGGHLAALLTSSHGMEYLEGDGGYSDQSSVVQAGVAMGAQSDLETDRIIEQSSREDDPFYRPFLGGSFEEVPLQYAAASPRHHFDTTDPPLLFITGERDHVSTRAEPSRAHLKRLRIETGLVVLDDAPHAFLGRQRAFDACVQACDEFFSKHLKREEPKAESK